MPRQVNAMSVDVEDYFQVAALSEVIRRQDWDQHQLRVQNNHLRIIDLFNQHNIKATFFVLGWVAERCPEIVKSILKNGHELASHGYAHHCATDQTPEEFRQDVQRSLDILQDQAGIPIRGYRAPSYSINKDNFWAFDVLQELGLQYSSSVYPIKHDLYGIPDAPRTPFYPLPQGNLIELPVTTLKMYGRNYPGGGGGYFRLFPYSLSRWIIQKVNKEMPSIFYFHPWEIDPEQPRQENLSFKSRFRHYVQLNNMENKLNKLLSDFQWNRIDEVFLNHCPQPEIRWSPVSEGL